MTNDDARALVTGYSDWLRAKVGVRPLELGPGLEVELPFLDRHNDRVQVYVVPHGESLVLTDLGSTVRDLNEAGFALTTETRERQFREIINAFDVDFKEPELVIEAERENFAPRCNRLVQAMLALGGLCHATPDNVASLFVEDVASWLARDLKARVTRGVSFTGKSGFKHDFDFVIPASQTHPERVVDVFKRTPSRAAAERLAFAWTDTRAERPEGARLFVAIDDRKRAPAKHIVEALERYEIVPLPWTGRDRFMTELAA